MEGKKPSVADELSGPKVASVRPTWYQLRNSSRSKFSKLSSDIRTNQVQPQVQRDLSASEFLDYLRKQVSCRQCHRMTAGEDSQEWMDLKDWNKYNHSRTIDRFNIGSSAYYGSRDTYPASNITSSGNPKIEEDRKSSPSDLLSQEPTNQVQPQVQTDLSVSEFLEYLRKQVSCRHCHNMTAGGDSQGNMDLKDWNKFDHIIAIDQSNIGSSMDYGSRDYYPPSNIASSGNRKVNKENELDDLYSVAARGNWWQGSVYY